MKGHLITALLLIAASWCAWAQTPETKVHELEKRPVFRIDVVEKITVAINYRHRSGATTIDFRGTPLMPRARGEAKVESKRGYIEIEAEFKNLKPAITFGAEYLTYVLWAITPEGRAANLGEILVKNGRSKLNVTTELQVFGLVVTAEPYFAVRQPSDLVVLENEVRPETKGKIEVIDAKYELLKRGQYEPLANPLALTVDPRVPLELYEARNAVQIARSMGADRYAEDIFLKAERSLRQAEAYQARNAGKKPVAMLAREAVQRAEDAREIAVRRREQERLAREREEAARREAAARAAAEAEAQRRAAEEARRREREEAVRQARAEAEREAAARKRLEAELAAARQEAAKAREEARQAMQLLKERTASFGQERARWEQERARREQEDMERRRRLEELEKAKRRVEIYGQLSRILRTRDTDEGLLVEIPAEWFAADEAQLSPGGRETLALIAGVLLAHPGLAFSARVRASPEQADGEAPGDATAETNKVEAADPGTEASEVQAARPGARPGAAEPVNLAGERLAAVRDYLEGLGVPEAARQTAELVEKSPTPGEGGGNGPPPDGPIELLITGAPIGL